MKSKSFVSLEKAAEIVNKCECCNTITEIVTALERYNIINVTDYKLDIEYKLYTTKNCTNCNLSKSLINSQTLRIKIIEAEEKDVDYLIQNDIGTFPVLEIKAGERVEFIYGKNVGGFIATNLEMFK